VIPAEELHTWPPMPAGPGSDDAITRDASSWPRHKARERARRKRRRQPKDGQP
jgi:hypothetical protein